MLKFLLGLSLGGILGVVAHMYAVDNPRHRDNVEEAYFMGCAVGIDILISGEYNEKTCSNLKYYKDR